MDIDQPPNPGNTYHATRKRILTAPEGKIAGLLRQGELSWAGDEHYPHMFLNLGGIWVAQPEQYFYKRELPDLGNLLIAAQIFVVAYDKQRFGYSGFPPPNLIHSGDIGFLGGRGLEISGNGLGFTCGFTVVQTPAGFDYKSKILERTVWVPEDEITFVQHHCFARSQAFSDLSRLLALGIIEMRGKLRTAIREPRVILPEELGSALAPVEGNPYSLRVGDEEIFDISLCLSSRFMPEELRRDFGFLPELSVVTSDGDEKPSSPENTKQDKPSPWLYEAGTLQKVWVMKSEVELEAKRRMIENGTNLSEAALCREMRTMLDEQGFKGSWTAASIEAARKKNRPK